MAKPEKNIMVSPYCLNCIYLSNGNSLKTAEGYLTCLAFYPSGIPEEIWSGSVLHDRAHKDQKGRQRRILYTPLSGSVIP
jgi:hypothetical protein